MAPEPEPESKPAERRVPASRWWYLLLVPPYVASLWVGSYDRLEPSLGGLPFFYWYQFLWVIIAAVLTAVVYLKTADREG